MRPFQRGIVIVVTVLMAGFVGFGIATMTAGPSLAQRDTFVISPAALTPTAGPSTAAIASPAPTSAPSNPSLVLGAQDPDPAPGPEEAIPTPAPLAEPEEPTPSPTAFQIRELTNLRAEANPDAPILKVLAAGDEVLVLSETQTAPDGGVWVKVRFAELEGWLNSRLMR